MGVFLESEKLNQIRFKAESADLSDKARIDGSYKGKARPFCLPVNCSEQNLFSGIRDSAITFFRNHGIKWHDGINGKPSNHLCSSQVCCVNFLFPFADKPRALESMLKPIYPDIKRILPIESGQYVSFEWIGRENYLGEKMPRNGKRTRGANCTSADAVVMKEHPPALLDNKSGGLGQLFIQEGEPNPKQAYPECQDNEHGPLANPCRQTCAKAWPGRHPD